MKILLPALLVLVSGLDPEPPTGGTVAEPDTAPAQDAFQPQAEHIRLQKLAGTWEAVIVTADPQGGEQRARGTLTTVEHAAYHTLETFQGEFMGMPFTGHGVNGYCTVRKQYFTFWTDSMTSSPMTLFGDYDAEKRELVMKGECFGMSGKLEPCRTVTHYQDDDHYSWAMFGVGPDGQEIQHLRVEYTRKK